MMRHHVTTRMTMQRHTMCLRPRGLLLVDYVRQASDIALHVMADTPVVGEARNLAADGRHSKQAVTCVRKWAVVGGRHSRSSNQTIPASGGLHCHGGHAQHTWY